jgi:hypothetical protein
MADVDQLRADLEAVRQARIDLAAGNRVNEIWRDGRRLTTGDVTIESLTTLIGIYEQDIAKAEATACGRPARHSFGFRFGG